MRTGRRRFRAAGWVAAGVLLAGCGAGGDSGDGSPDATDSVTDDAVEPPDDGGTEVVDVPDAADVPDTADVPPPDPNGYVILAWNDLGMHCLNPTYDTAVILPPYNNLRAQVVARGNPPRLVTAGVGVSYSLPNNTFSYGKTDDLGADFGQFWDHVETLFGVALERDRGLNLVDPALHNGLAGSMVAEADRFAVEGVPVTPVNDPGTWNPFQVGEVVARDGAGRELARTRLTVPTSDEIVCSTCHGAAAPFEDLLTKHDTRHATTLMAGRPVLCASCHGSPALGGTGPGAAGKYLSQAVHGAHAARGATCYNCHPGPATQCSRSLRHTAADGNCITCHGDLATVASTIASGERMPWAQEPKCAQCHPASIPQVDTGETLYRNATGHGGLACEACHGSPHAQVPSREAPDNYQAIQYQGAARVIGSCHACHPTSRGDPEVGGFGEAHGGTSPEARSACSTCHTVVPTDTARWPHQFQWRSR